MAVQREDDDGPAAERVWPARLRWRLRGAWQWPVFVVLTAADAVVLVELPYSGDGWAPMAAVLLAGFANLAVVAILAPLGGMLVRRGRTTLPPAVAADRAGTVLLVALAAALLAGGIANRSTVTHDRADRAAALRAARAWFAHNAPGLYAAHQGRESVWNPGPGLFRTCVPSAREGRDLCVYVDTSGPNVTVTRDHDQQPNSVIAGPDNPGRQTR